MISEPIRELREAIVRHSPLIADNIGLMTTGHELKWLYESIGEHYKAQEEYLKHRSIGALRKAFIKHFGWDYYGYLFGRDEGT